MTNIKSAVLSSLAISLLTVATPTMSVAWDPPIGIPAPPFGITQAAPARPNPWTGAVAGWYYVDQSGSGATDSGNANGYPGKPRQTIPNPIPAGAVVELHGTHSTDYMSPRSLVFQGTASSPAYIRGMSSTGRPVATGNWEIMGTYGVVENIEFAPDAAYKGSALIFSFDGSSTHHIAFRNNELHGNAGGGGLSVNNVSNIVIASNVIRDNGDVNATFDQDIHGISVGPPTSNLWVVDNELARNSGDGIQINGGTGGQSAIHHIYFGRNVSHGNKQSGFWVKQAVDVIFSQNTAYNHRPGNSSPGGCAGFQYAPNYVWFLFNHLYDCEIGIYVGSDSGLGSGTESFFIGNVIHDIRNTGGFNANSGWANGAMTLAGGVNRYIINNTMYRVDAGINTPSSSGATVIVNNIIGGLQQSQGNHIFLEMTGVANNSTVTNNLFDGALRVRWPSTTYTSVSSFQSGTGKCQGCLNADPVFVNAAGNDFRLQSSSPAIEAGAAHAAYTTFQNRYGINIAKDINGLGRPVGTKFDIGAYEFGSPAGGGGGGGGAQVPSAPSGLTIN